MECDGKQLTSELYEQQIHDLRKQLNVLKVMEQEYMTDIEGLQQKYESDINAQRTKVRALEDKLALQERDLLNKIDVLELDKKAESESYESRLAEVEGKVKGYEDMAKQLSSKEELLHQLQCETKELRERTLRPCEDCVRLQEQNVALSRRIEELNAQLLEIREVSAVQRENLAASADKLVSVQEKLVLLEAQHTMLKSQPQDDTKKGNSLFAEVEDKRQSMKKNLEAALMKYSRMKKQYMAKCAEASKFRSEYVFLCRKCDEIKTALREEDTRLINSYVARIKFLEEENNKLQLAKPPYVFTNADQQSMKKVEAFVEFYRQKAEKIKSELEEESVKALFSGETLHQVQRKLHQSELELVQTRRQVVELQGLLQEREEKKSEDQDMQCT